MGKSVSEQAMRAQTVAYVHAVLSAHPDLNPEEIVIDPYPVRPVRPLLGRCGIKKITHFICRRTGYTPEELCGPSQDPNIVRARWEAFVLAKKKGYSICEISREYNRDHTTVRYGLKKMGVIR